ncbi:hypothetical protein RRG08_041066 [Elysia crispata]|uniref:Uncharacterized protein n=1 Tax=Elysia crispata TaxID=231223 RepID=A0AAE1CU14_9GAST|nr:hypothetical protein RRG08_041066 [Elysia crispata]
MIFETRYLWFLTSLRLFSITLVISSCVLSQASLLKTTQEPPKSEPTTTEAPAKSTKSVSETTTTEAPAKSTKSEPTTTEAPAKSTKSEPTTTEAPAKSTKSVSETTTTEAPAKSTKSEPTTTEAPAKSTKSVSEPTTTEAPAKSTKSVSEPTTTEAPAKSTKSVSEPTTTEAPAKSTKSDACTIILIVVTVVVVVVIVIIFAVLRHHECRLMKRVQVSNDDNLTEHQAESSFISKVSRAETRHNKRDAAISAEQFTNYDMIGASNTCHYYSTEKDLYEKIVEKDMPTGVPGVSITEEFSESEMRPEYCNVDDDDPGTYIRLTDERCSTAYGNDGIYSTILITEMGQLGGNERDSLTHRDGETEKAVCVKPKVEL